MGMQSVRFKFDLHGMANGKRKGLFFVSTILRWNC